MPDERPQADWLLPEMSGTQLPPSRALRRMHGKFGHAPDGTTCGTCTHIVRVRPGRNDYFKCALFGFSSSAASDWRLKWPACGQHGPKGVPTP